MVHDQDEDIAGSTRTPPYIAWQTLKTLLHELKAHGVPGRIDRSILTRFSGATGTQLLTALKFMRLTDEEGVPTDMLRALTVAFEGPEWTKELDAVLRFVYRPVFQLDLTTATPAQFAETFRRAFPAKENVLRKCVAFFLNAVREAGIPMSPRILKDRKERVPRAPQSRAAISPRKLPVAAAVRRAGAIAAPVAAAIPKDTAGVLLEMLSPSAMSPEEQQAVWTLLLYLKKQDQTAS